MHAREERLAMNLVLFRKANDGIKSAPGSTPGRRGGRPLLRCSARDCTERILITAQEPKTSVSTPPSSWFGRATTSPAWRSSSPARRSTSIVEKTGEAAKSSPSVSKTS